CRRARRRLPTGSRRWVEPAARRARADQRESRAEGLARRSGWRPPKVRPDLAQLPEVRRRAQEAVVQLEPQAPLDPRPISSRADRASAAVPDALQVAQAPAAAMAPDDLARVVA